MAAAAMAEPPSSALAEEGLPSPSPSSPSSSSSPSPSPSPTRSPSPSSHVAKTAANDDSSPDRAADLPPPPQAGIRFHPSLAAALRGGSANHHHHPSSSRRLPPPCWTQEETDALIQSYRNKWYGLMRGNLRASHWEEVAEAVARRCRHLYTPAGSNTPKTAVQCRHKMEKLRKRYRSEKKRPHRTSWVHFRDMDAMEMGTPPAAAAAVSRSKAAVAAAAAAAAPETYSDDNEEDESDDDDDDDEEDDEDGHKKIGGTRSIHAVMSKANGIDDLRFQIPKAVRSKVGTPRADDRGNGPNIAAFYPKSHRPSGSNGCFPGEMAARKPPSAADEMRKRMEERRRKEREGTVLGEVVSAVRMLGDGFMRVEEMKMEMAREMEKLRMEMELKRTEMILESQRRIVDAFVTGLTRGQKKKRANITP